MNTFTETTSRSLAKALSWRVLGTLATTLVVYALTRRVEFALVTGVLELTLKVALYFGHERLWDRISFGRHEEAPAVIWLTGLSGSGKTTVAIWLTAELLRRGFRVEHLDGDAIREIFPNTGFTRTDRDAHIKRVGYLASKLESHGVVVIVSLISPYADSRAFVRRICRRFFEVYVATPIEECERRDVKGLYARARRGELVNVTGIDDPYDVPRDAEVTFDSREVSIGEAGQMVVNAVWPRTTISSIGTQKGA